MVSIEEVANRNKLTLYRTSRPGQWKAHCPVCKDGGREFHLYVNTDKDTFFCQKCHHSGGRGGVVAFHAWLNHSTFEEARIELYPPSERKTTRLLHPAERLTKTQLDELGFTWRTPSPIPPKGVEKRDWYRRRKAELDWVWREWTEHERFRKEQWERLSRLLAPSEISNAV